jgi:hypothetical protein
VNLWATPIFATGRTVAAQLRWKPTDMCTIAVWAFFILWGIVLIQSVVHRNLVLIFNCAVQMYVMREFVVGNVEAS